MSVLQISSTFDIKSIKEYSISIIIDIPNDDLLTKY